MIHDMFIVEKQFNKVSLDRAKTDVCRSSMCRILESLTHRDAIDAQLFDMLVEQSQQALSICDM